MRKFVSYEKDLLLVFTAPLVDVVKKDNYLPMPGSAKVLKTQFEMFRAIFHPALKKVYSLFRISYRIDVAKTAKYSPIETIEGSIVNSFNKRCLFDIDIIALS